MPVIDERGRLFGVVNLIDAFVGIVILLLIPLAYGAYVLFRTQPPRIVSVEGPASAGGNRLTVHGEHFRAFLKAKIDEDEVPLAVLSPTLAEVQLPPKLPPGTHTLILLDEAQELSRLPITVGSGERTADVVVRFVVRPEVLPLVKVGATSLSSATLSGIANERQLRSLAYIGLDPDPSRMDRANYQVEQDVVQFDGTVRLVVRETADGWHYAGRILKPETLFVFETPAYAIRGWVLSVNVAAPPPAAGGAR